MTTYTPTPWELYPMQKDRIGGPDGNLVALTGTKRATMTDWANAAFIVKAVNNFEAMREALKGMLHIQDSVTQGQERELKAEWIPKTRALLASLERSAA